MKESGLVYELQEKYSEYLEMMTEEQSSAFLIDIMAVIIIKERELKEFYKTVAYANSQV